MVTLINRDYGALAPSERDALLAAVYLALRPGGFFAEGRHLLIAETLLYAELERQIVVAPNGSPTTRTSTWGFWRSSVSSESENEG